MEQNIYFIESVGADTVIFKYDSRRGKLIELGKVSGTIKNCVIDKEETRITGFLYGPILEGGHRIGIIEYDIKTGTVTEKNVIEKINELTGDPSWGGTLYDGGNKVLVSYTNKENKIRRLSYDMETEKSEDVPINGVILQYLAFNEEALWYRGYYTICWYDWQTKEDHVAPFFFDDRLDVALEPTEGLMAYIDNSSITGNEEIFICDIDQRETTRITTAGWNIYYGNLRLTNAIWTGDSRRFCYVESFPLLFNVSNKRVMIYDLESGRHRCIYKEWNTTNHIEFIPYH